MGFKDEETRKAYYRDYQRQRRAEQAGKAEVADASVGKVTSPLPSSLSPKESAESPSALATTEEQEMGSTRIDGQVHLLSKMGVFRAPDIVFTMSKRLLESQGWCLWRYPTLENAVWVILRDHMVTGYPRNIHTLTCNPERSLEIELKMNIPGCMN